MMILFCFQNKGIIFPFLCQVGLLGRELVSTREFLKFAKNLTSFESSPPALSSWEISPVSWKYKKCDKKCEIELKFVKLQKGKKNHLITNWWNWFWLTVMPEDGGNVVPSSPKSLLSSSSSSDISCDSSTQTFLTRGFVSCLGNTRSGSQVSRGTVLQNSSSTRVGYCFCTKLQTS